jgi:hypothetical protein
MSKSSQQEPDETTRTDRAIEALLTCTDLASAARKAGVPYSSFRRLITTPAFQVEMRQARCAVLDGALVYLRGLAMKSVVLIEECIDGKPISALRLSCARWVIDKGLEGMVSDLTARMDAYEKRGT